MSVALPRSFRPQSLCGHRRSDVRQIGRRVGSCIAGGMPLRGGVEARSRWVN
jgi:hypothetical protein